MLHLILRRPDDTPDEIDLYDLLCELIAHLLEYMARNLELLSVMTAALASRDRNQMSLAIDRYWARRNEEAR